MVQQVKKVIPTEYEQVKPRSASKEPDDTNKTSTVAKSKKNKYGI
jgi:hypothetical protein